jgi:hypothetical protein
MEQRKDPLALKRIEETLNSLERSELITLNNMIIQRIKFLDDFTRFALNSQFYPGQKVSWIDRAGQVRFGKILRINRKTISIRENNDEAGIWKVSASLLTRII